MKIKGKEKIWEELRKRNYNQNILYKKLFSIKMNYLKCAIIIKDFKFTLAKTLIYN